MRKTHHDVAEKRQGAEHLPFLLRTWQPCGAQHGIPFYCPWIHQEQGNIPPSRFVLESEGQVKRAEMYASF